MNNPPHWVELPWSSQLLTFFSDKFNDPFNRPFVWLGHRVQNPLCLMANGTAQHMYSTSTTEFTSKWLTSLYNFIFIFIQFFSCPTVPFAIQLGSFCTTWPSYAKGLQGKAGLIRATQYPLGRYSLRCLCVSHCLHTLANLCAMERSQWKKDFFRTIFQNVWHRLSLCASEPRVSWALRTRIMMSYTGACAIGSKTIYWRAQTGIFFRFLCWLVGKLVENLTLSRLSDTLSVCVK